MTDLIIDGNSLYARCYYAAMREETVKELEGFERTKDPVLVGVRMMLNIIDPSGSRIRKKIDRILFCWDGRAKAEKRRLHEKPDDYDSWLLQFVQAMKDVFGAAHFRHPDYEADDAVATAVYNADPTNKVYVVSGDKDLQQLQSGNVDVYCLTNAVVLTRQSILDRWHVKRPSQICIALAVLGDPGDNVPGIRGWGKKKVEKLFDSIKPDMDLETVLRLIEDQIPPKRLKEFRDSLDLTVLDPDVPGVPEPLPITFPSIELLCQLGLETVAGKIMQVQAASDSGYADDIGSFIDAV